MITTNDLLEAGEKAAKYFQAIEQLPEAVREAATKNTIEQLTYLEMSAIAFVPLVAKDVTNGVSDEVLEAKAQRVCAGLIFLESLGIDLDAPGQKYKHLKGEIEALRESALALSQKIKEVNGGKSEQPSPAEESDTLPDPWDRWESGSKK